MDWDNTTKRYGLACFESTNPSDVEAEGDASQEFDRLEDAQAWAAKALQAGRSSTWSSGTARPASGSGRRISAPPRIPMTDEAQIARVARALCALDRYDPDEAVHLGTDEIETGGQTYTHDVLVPAWTTYVSEARRVIAAVRASGLMG